MAPKWSLTIKSEGGTTIRAVTDLAADPRKVDANGVVIAVHWVDADGEHDLAIPAGWEVIVKQTST